MKPLTIALLLLLTALPGMQAQNVNMTLTLTDSDGRPQPNREAQLRLTLVDAQDENTVFYCEQQEVTSNPYGAVHLAIGTGSPIAGRWEEIDWSAGRHALRMERMMENGSYAVLGQMPLGAVPYSYHSQTASALRLKSPDGTLWNVSASNDGTLKAEMAVPADAPAYGTVDYIFDQAALPTITIEVTTQEWNTLLDNYDLNRDNEECIHADFHFSKYGRVHTIPDIGLRLRGNTSRVRPEGKKGEHHTPGNRLRHVHLGFRFQKFHKDDSDWTLSGTDRFNLRWAHEDPSYVREIYGYDLMRRFGVWTAARCSHCRVYLKFAEEEQPVYLGVSEMFECYDDQYLADHTEAGRLGGTKGFLWKGSWGSGQGAFFDDASTRLMGIENQSLDPAETESYTYDYKGKKKKLEEAREQLASFISDLNGKKGEDFRNWAEEHIDVDLLLRAMAVEVATGHWDDMWANGNNFYFYFDNDGDGRMRYIPYDMDNTLGTSGGWDAATANPYEWGRNPLASRILEVPEWRQRFTALLLELADPGNDYLDPERSAERIQRWQEKVRDHVANDTGDDSRLSDNTASWGSTPQYRLLGEQDNFFKAKVRSIRSFCSQ